MKATKKSAQPKTNALQHASEPNLAMRAHQADGHEGHKGERAAEHDAPAADDVEAGQPNEQAQLDADAYEHLLHAARQHSSK